MFYRNMVRLLKHWNRRIWSDTSQNKQSIHYKIQMCTHRCTSHVHIPHQHMHIHEIVSAAWRQSAFTLFFWTFQRHWKPSCVRQRHSRQLHHRKSTAKQPLAFPCHGRCPDPSGWPQPLTFIVPTHTENTETPGQTVHGVERQHRVPLVWVLTLMRTQSGDGWKLRSLERGRTQRRSSSVVTQRQEETSTTKHLFPLLPAAGRGESRGPLSIVRHNTGISVCRHLGW